MLSEALRRRAKRERPRCAFIPYVMAGDPDLATTEAMHRGDRAAGADAIELGIPYSDPLADGPTIAAAGAARARESGTRPRRRAAGCVRRRAADARRSLLFTYFNPVDQYGAERFAPTLRATPARAARSFPISRWKSRRQLRAALHARGLEMPLLVAPSTPRERAARIAAASDGFVYVVSRLGVTGSRHDARFRAAATRNSQRCASVTEKPLAVGFGLSRAADVRAIAPFADGVIVGSALIDAYAGAAGEDAVARVSQIRRTADRRDETIEVRFGDSGRASFA